jgi:hypothetical protein
MNLTFYIEILADVFYTIGILTDLGHESDSYLTSWRRLTHLPIAKRMHFMIQ